ncbi:MAG: ADP-ribosylation factor-like protein [Candidatus Heimdallarchaeota archaeon]
MKTVDSGTLSPRFIIAGVSRSGKSSVLRALEREFFRCFQEIFFSPKGEYRKLANEKLTICEMNENQIKESVARGSTEFNKCNGVIFLVDLAIPDQFPSASNLLGYILDHTTPQTELAILGHKIDVTGLIPIDEIIERLELGTLPIHQCHTFSVLHTSVMQDNGLSPLVDWIGEHFCELMKPLRQSIREIFIYDANGIPLGYVGDIAASDSPILVSAVYSALETFLEKIGGSSIKTFVLEGDDGPVHVAKHSEKDKSVLFVSGESWSSPSRQEAGKAVLELFETTEREFDALELSIFDKDQFLMQLDEIFFSGCAACEKYSKRFRNG